MKNISIEDKYIFDKFLNELNFYNSEYVFSTLFLWQERYQFKYVIYDEMIIVFGTQSNSKEYCYYPIGRNCNIAKYYQYIKSYFTSGNRVFNIRTISQGMLFDLLPCMEETYIIGTKESYSDYIYYADDIRKMAGKKYHHKRNLVNYFCNNYNYSIKIIESHEDIQNCKNAFLYILDNNNYVDVEEKNVGIKLFDNFDELNLKGCYVTIDNKIEGIAIGELYKDDYVLLHLRKGNKNVRGIYPFLFQKFLNIVFPNVKFVNSQDDMGLENIRKSKLSYRPNYLIKKYYIEERT